VKLIASGVAGVPGTYNNKTQLIENLLSVIIKLFSSFNKRSNLDSPYQNTSTDGVHKFNGFDYLLF